MQRSGTIDKYIGDAIMAFWNAPLDVPDHARLACLAALAMAKRVRELGEKAQAAGADRAPTIRIGIGINSGECYVGNMGSEQRFNYSVLGDPVNVASRLEGQSKVYAIEIVVCDTTMAAASELAGLRLQGRSRSGCSGCLAMPRSLVPNSSSRWLACTTPCSKPSVDRSGTAQSDI
jgi:adenylate cyclase